MLPPLFFLGSCCLAVKGLTFSFVTLTTGTSTSTEYFNSSWFFFFFVFLGCLYRAGRIIVAQLFHQFILPLGCCTQVCLPWCFAISSWRQYSHYSQLGRAFVEELFFISFLPEFVAPEHTIPVAHWQHEAPDCAWICNFPFPHVIYFYRGYDRPSIILMSPAGCLGRPWAKRHLISSVFLCAVIAFSLLASYDWSLYLNRQWILNSA